MKKLFTASLKWCAAHEGRLDNVLYSIFKLLSLKWTADTQEVEGYMSLIQSAVARAPYITEPQLDARVGNAVDLRVGTAAAKRQKWSQKEPLIKSVISDAVEHHDAGKALFQVGWYATPPPLDRKIPKVPAQAPLLSQRAKKWAAARALDFHRLCKRNRFIASGSVLVSISDSDSKTLAFWMCPLTHAYTGMMLKMEPSLVDGAGAGVDVRISVPTVAMSSPDMFAEYYDVCVVGKFKLLVTFSFISWGLDGGAQLSIFDGSLDGDSPLVELEMVLDQTMPKAKPGPLAIADAVETDADHGDAVLDDPTVEAVFDDGCGGDDPIDPSELEVDAAAFPHDLFKSIKAVKSGDDVSTVEPLLVDPDVCDDLADAHVVEDLKHAASGIAGLDFAVVDQSHKDDHAVYIEWAAAFTEGVAALREQALMAAAPDETPKDENITCPLCIARNLTAALMLRLCTGQTLALTLASLFVWMTGTIARLQYSVIFQTIIGQMCVSFNATLAYDLDDGTTQNAPTCLR